MNLQEASRLTGMSPEQIFDITNKTADIELSDINPLLEMPESSEQTPEYVTISEAAEITGYSTPHIYYLMNNGKIPYVTINGRKRPLRAGLKQEETTNTEVIETMLENDPALRLHILQKYGIEDILDRLNKIEIALADLRERDI